MKKSKEKAVRVAAKYDTPALHVVCLVSPMVLCSSPFTGEGTEQYEDGENYGEDW